MFYLWICVCTTRVLCLAPVIGQKRVSELKTEPGSSGREEGALNHWATSPYSPTQTLFLVHFSIHHVWTCFSKNISSAPWFISFFLLFSTLLFCLYHRPIILHLSNKCFNSLKLGTKNSDIVCSLPLCISSILMILTALDGPKITHILDFTHLTYTCLFDILNV